MRALLAAGILGTVVVTTTLLAQAPANFAGKWTLVPDPSASAAGGRGGFGALGQGATITQDATTLTITRMTQAGEFTSTYKLDGSESKNTLNIQGNSIEQLSRARWDGSRLIVETTINLGGTPADITMVMWLDDAGNLLVESTRPDFQGGGGPITTKATYKKG